MERRPDFPSPLSSSVSGDSGRGDPGPATHRRAVPRARRSGGTPPVDVRAWLGGIRFSGFMAIMLGLVVLAVFVLVPSVGTYLEQRQRIASLQEGVSVTEAEVLRLEAERERWSDANYISSQARERLYYVKPGEVVYLVDNDLDESLLPQEHRPVSSAVKHTRVDWMSMMLRSVTEAGLAKSIAPTPLVASEIVNNSTGAPPTEGTFED